jgi:hypothetical protein
MEPEVRIFLQKVSSTLGLSLIWMMINLTFGIYYKWGYVYDKVDTINIIFYIFLLLSFLFLVWYIFKTWRNYKDPTIH